MEKKHPGNKEMRNLVIGRKRKKKFFRKDFHWNFHPPNDEKKNFRFVSKSTTTTTIPTHHRLFRFFFSLSPK
mgnify:CR=1 FL=1